MTNKAFKASNRNKQLTMDILNKIWCKEKESTLGQMVIVIMEIGLIAKDMAKELLFK